MILSGNGLLLMLFAVALGFIAQGYVSSTYRRYSQDATSSGMTGAQAARRILDMNGLSDVSIQRIGGNLTDNYDPRSRVLSLSAAVYDGNSVAAAGVAAHESGHAVQHARGYAPMSLRSALVPTANIGSRVAPVLILVGFLIGAGSLLGNGFVWAGIGLFGIAVLFQLVTLPVEFNASDRALESLAPAGIVSQEQLPGARKVLNAAALTYVAATLISVMYLLYYIGLAGRRD